MTHISIISTFLRAGVSYKERERCREEVHAYIEESCKPQPKRNPNPKAHVTTTTTGSLNATTAASIQSNTTGHGSNDVMIPTMPASVSLNAMMLPTATTTGSLNATTAASIQSNTTGHGSNDVMIPTMPASVSLNAMMLPTQDAQRNLMMFMQMQQQQQQFLMQMMFMNYHKNT